MTFEDIKWDYFKIQASEFFKTTEKHGCSLESAENGHKALALMYFGHADDWSDREINEASILIDLAGKRLLEIELKDGE